MKLGKRLVEKILESATNLLEKIQKERAEKQLDPQQQKVAHIKLEEVHLLKKVWELKAEGEELRIELRKIESVLRFTIWLYQHFTDVISKSNEDKKTFEMIIGKPEEFKSVYHEISQIIGGQFTCKTKKIIVYLNSKTINKESDEELFIAIDNLQKLPLVIRKLLRDQKRLGSEIETVTRMELFINSLNNHILSEVLKKEVNQKITIDGCQRSFEEPDTYNKISATLKTKITSETDIIIAHLPTTDKD